tara:strand:+ start:1351 stop:2307 length:957 start_codon:yes stop_codon:yes gene_type:complete
MATVKITQLPLASSGDITSNTDVLPIIDGSTTKQITVDNLFGTATHITASGVISSSKVDSEFSLYAHSASFNYISASTGDFDANTIRIGGSSFSKTDIDNLKAGKSISTDSNKKFVNSADDTTFVRMGDSGKAWHYISGSPILKLGIGAINIGDSSTLTTIGSAGIGGGSSALIITGSSGMQVAGGGLTAMAGMLVTGSTEISGSCSCTGSFDVDTLGGGFNVNNLLDLLSNFGQTGIATGSAATGSEGGVGAGDINLDGQVNVNDILLLLAGYGNPNCIVQNLTIPQNTNYQLVGPEICISQSVVVTVCNNSYFSIT